MVRAAFARGTKMLGSICLDGRDARGKQVVVMHRSSINPQADSTLIYKALEFRDAAKRDGRVFVCSLVKPWQARIIKMLGVKL